MWKRGDRCISAIKPVLSANIVPPPVTSIVSSGAKPAELPIQLPTKFQFVVNLKTAKSLGLTVPAMLLATADDVIE
jgi:hypothetical protein